MTDSERIDGLERAMLDAHLHQTAFELAMNESQTMAEFKRNYQRHYEQMCGVRDTLILERLYENPEV